MWWQRDGPSATRVPWSDAAALVAEHERLLLPPRAVQAVAGGWDAFESAMAAANGRVLLVPDAINQPVIDAADGPRRAFQMTLGAKKKVSAKISPLLTRCQVREDEVFELRCAQGGVQSVLAHDGSARSAREAESALPRRRPRPRQAEVL